MSVLSRPVRHEVTVPTQREVRIPLPRTQPEQEGRALRPSPQITRPAPMPDRRARKIVLVGGALAVALGVGVGTYVLVEDDGGGSATAPPAAYVPTASDLALDRAAAARGPAGAGLPTGITAVTAAERAAAQAQRLHNSGDATSFAGSSTAGSDAARLSEAERNAELARRARNVDAGDIPVTSVQVPVPATGTGPTSGLLGTVNPLGPPAS